MRDARDIEGSIFSGYGICNFLLHGTIMCTRYNPRFKSPSRKIPKKVPYPVYEILHWIIHNGDEP